jgi:hypothetical protein
MSPTSVVCRFLFLIKDGSSYTGINDARFYDLDGNMFAEATGTAVAKRISPP